jgi:hypothetical protein
LPALVGHCRASEVSIGADAGTAERYGWINRAVADNELDGFVDVEQTFRELAATPLRQIRVGTMMGRGLQQAGDIEPRLGHHIGDLGSIRSEIH